MRIATVVGARPQFIKAAPVSAALEGRATEILIHTGQHYDADMSAAFFDELGLSDPRYNLGVGSGRQGEQTGRMLAAVEEVLVAERPDLVLVYGDTNSTLAGALAAVKLEVPVAHVEAGLRSFDRRMPEEVNRVVTDHLASLLFAPSPIAVANLAAEGIAAGVHDVGDVMVDALMSVGQRVSSASPPAGLHGHAPGEYVVATIHRAATTDDPAALARAVHLLKNLDVPVVFPVHPRTRAALGRDGLLADLEGCDTVTVTAPQSYLTMVGLMSGARAVVTDSGGMQKEAYLLGVPCVTLRNETEWVETVEAGWNSLVGLDLERARQAIAMPPPTYRPALYGDGHAAERIAAILTG